MRVEEWQDRATNQKRKGTKIVAATLDRVRPFSMGGARPPAIPMVRGPAQGLGLRVSRACLHCWLWWRAPVHHCHGAGPCLAMRV